jgi:hypothetical protein
MAAGFRSLQIGGHQKNEKGGISLSGEGIIRQMDEAGAAFFPLQFVF